MPEKHTLGDDEAARGRRSSAFIRTTMKNEYLWQVRGHLIALAKAGLIGATLRERADQLNARGVRTVKGLPLDAQKLSAALILLGADANSIKCLQLKAIKYADVFGVEEAEMFDQLWHEWLYHHTRIFLEHGVMGMSKDHLFNFSPMRPGEWNKNRPEMRDLRVYRWWYRTEPFLPPQAGLIFALFGMFGYVKVSNRTGKMRRQLVP